MGAPPWYLKWLASLGDTATMDTFDWDQSGGALPLNDLGNLLGFNPAGGPPGGGNPNMPYLGMDYAPGGNGTPNNGGSSNIPIGNGQSLPIGRPFSLMVGSKNGQPVYRKYIIVRHKPNKRNGRRNNRREYSQNARIAALERAMQYRR